MPVQKKMVSGLSLAAGILCAVSFSQPAVAQGGFNGPGRYEIVNIHSGKVLDLDRNDQTTVIQFSARGTDNQVWEIESAGGGFYTLRSSMNGNALEAAGTGNSAPLHATRFDGRSSQQWRIDNANGGNGFLGDIDEVHFWNIDRTSSQIMTQRRLPLIGSQIDAATL